MVVYETPAQGSMQSKCHQIKAKTHGRELQGQGSTRSKSH